MCTVSTAMTEDVSLCMYFCILGKSGGCPPFWLWSCSVKTVCQCDEHHYFYTVTRKRCFGDVSPCFTLLFYVQFSKWLQILFLMAVSGNERYERRDTLGLCFVGWYWPSRPQSPLCMFWIRMWALSTRGGSCMHTSNGFFGSWKKKHVPPDLLWNVCGNEVECLEGVRTQ